jgi:DNA-binding response OmpR family regulator
VPIMHAGGLTDAMKPVLGRPRWAIDILAIDDNRETTDTLADILTSHGFKVYIADDGMAALEFMERNPLPRVIVLGMFTSGMGGVEFLTYRKGSCWENVPLIVLSDLKTAEPIPGWAEQILYRSFDMWELLAAVRTATALPLASLSK